MTGNLFAADDDEALSELLEGKIEVPVSTYFTVGSKELPQRVFDKLSKDEDVGFKTNMLAFTDSLGLRESSLPGQEKYDKNL